MKKLQPHIILITADQLRKDALGCYGNQAVQTPNLDRLAKKSIQFHRCYTASPLCLPSRSALVTGRYPHNNGAYSNFRETSLDPETSNLFNELKKNGYYTTMFGKCHFTPVPYDSTCSDVTLPYDKFRQYYLDLGLEHLELQDGKQVSVWFQDDYSKELDNAGYLESYRKAVWEKNNQRVFSFPAPSEWHPDSWVGRKANEFILSYKADKPLFSWISFSGPHFPFDPPQKYLDRVNMEKDLGRHWKDGEFDDNRRIHHTSYHGTGGIEGAGTAPGKACKNYSEEHWYKLRKSYFANIAQIDEEVGYVLETIEKKFGEDVLIIFTADHGEMLGNHGLWGKNKCGYEDVLNVPLIVKYPQEEKGFMTDAKVMLTDIFATCMKTAGVEEKSTDGRDFREGIDQGGYSYVIAESEGFIAISNNHLKYIYANKNGIDYDELFDLDIDPFEFDNVIDQPKYASGLAELRKQMNKLFMKKLLA